MNTIEETIIYSEPASEPDIVFQETSGGSTIEIWFNRTAQDYIQRIKWNTNNRSRIVDYSEIDLRKFCEEIEYIVEGKWNWELMQPLWKLKKGEFALDCVEDILEELKTDIKICEQ